ncbi:hypothetical protein D3C83_155380 [compost metagenome]
MRQRVLYEFLITFFGLRYDEPCRAAQYREWFISLIHEIALVIADAKWKSCLRVRVVKNNR